MRLIMDSFISFFDGLSIFKNMYIQNTVTPVVLGMATSMALCLLIVWTQRWHNALTSDYLNGAQKLHTTATPRVGGAAIFLGLLIASSQAFDLVSPILNELLIAGSPAFVFGFAEDLSGRISVKWRYLATVASGILFVWLHEHSLSLYLISGLNWFMQLKGLSVLFTIVAIAGLAQSINIIDGLNGQASLMSFFAFSGFALIAYLVGDYALSVCCLILAAAVLGFFCVNWPFGKIFMGDGGAYFIGFALAAMAILLVERNYPVSDFAVLLICVHPVTEVLFSMYRRAASGASITQPDRLHFHTLLKMRYIRRWFGHWPRVARNSIAGAMVSLFTLLAVILAALSYKNVMLSAFFFVAMVAMYITLYTRMTRFGWNKPKRSKMPRAHARSKAQRTGRHQPPATSHQPPATSHQPPALTPPVQGIRACARPNPFRLSAP